MSDYEKKNIGIVLAAGLGTRMEQNKPKQYIEVLGKEIIAYLIDEYKAAESMDDFIVVVGKDEQLSQSVSKRYGVKTIAGGGTRNESIGNALKYINEHYEGCKYVFIDDAARPTLNSSLINQYFYTLQQGEYGYIITCSEIRDSLWSYKNKNNMPNRRECFLAAAPEAYDFGLLLNYFDPMSDVDFPALQLPSELTGYYYFGFKDNYKLTVAEDLTIIESLLQKKQGAKL